jgi:hypothetical protein
MSGISHKTKKISCSLETISVFLGFIKNPTTVLSMNFSRKTKVSTKKLRNNSSSISASKKTRIQQKFFGYLDLLPLLRLCFRKFHLIYFSIISINFSPESYKQDEIKFVSKRASKQQILFFMAVTYFITNNKFYRLM